MADDPQTPPSELVLSPDTPREGPNPDERMTPGPPVAQGTEGANFFDKFDSEPDAGEPGLWERARLNSVEGYYRGSLQGAGELSLLASIKQRINAGAKDEELIAEYAPALANARPDQKGHLAATMKWLREQRTKYDNIVSDLARYDAMRPWGSTLEAGAALAGQVGGGIMSPESLVGPFGRGATLLTRTLKAAGTAAAVNVATDPAVQALDMAAKVQNEYEPMRTALAAPLGAVVGGGLHLGGELIGPRLLKRQQAQMGAEDPSMRTAGDTVEAPRTEAPEPVPERVDNAPTAPSEGPAEPPASPPVAQTAPEPVVHRVSTPDGTSVDVKPTVMEARDLITSADAGYDAGLQPRDRDRAASQQQIREIASNLDPERLGFSTEADRGAPIIGPDSMVESGNGRILAIREAYSQNGEAAQRYRDWIAAQGIDVSGFREPVLVRQRVTELSPEERRAFTVGANQGATLGFSASERALADARLVTPDMLELIRNSNDLGAVANRDFVRAFMEALPPTERAAMTTAEGGLTSEGLARVRNAVIGSAYGDAPILTRIAESTDDEIKSISNALAAVAPEWAKLRADVSAGHVRADVDQTEALIEAVSRTADLRNSGKKLDQFLAQQDAFDRVSPVVEDFMRLFYDKSGRKAAGANRITDALRYYSEEGRKVSEGGLDLGLPPVTVRDLQRGAADKAHRASSSAQQGALFLRSSPRDGANAAAHGREIRGPGTDQQGQGAGAAGLGGARQGANDATGGAGNAAAIEPLAARQSGGSLPMERSRPQAGVPSDEQTTGTAVATVPQAPSPQQEGAIRSLQQQAFDFADAIGFPLREGRMGGRSKSVLGFYKTKSGVVRVREVPDFEVVAHEGGHAIEAKVGADLTDLTEQFAAELAPLVSDPAAYDPSKHVKEGFAEFIRRFIGNPAHAAQVAPGFMNAFRDFMTQRRPDIMSALDNAAAAYRAYLEAPSVDAIGAVRRSAAENAKGIRGVISTVRENGFPQTIKNVMQWAYTSFLDRDAPLDRAVRDMNEFIKEQSGNLVDLKAADNPIVLQRLFARTEQASVRDMLDGIRPYREITPRGPSLSAAVAKATGDPSFFGRWDQAKVSTFSNYLIARRAEYLWRKFEAGLLPRPPTAFSKADAVVAMADHERANPTFREASDMAHGYSRELLRKMYDGNLISTDTYSKLLAEEFYVPFYRDLSDKPLAGASPPTGSGRERTPEVVHRMTGSARDIKDPIESLMLQTFLVNRAIRHNDIILALRNLARRAGREGGRFVEDIPANEARRYTFDLKDAIYRKAVERGMDPNAEARILADSMADMFGEDPLLGTFFRMEPAGKRGEPIVFYKEGGQMKAARLMAGEEGHALYETVTALPKGIDDVALQLLSVGSATLRSGIVLNPVYALTNYIRDQLAQFILRPDYAPFYSGAKGIVSEFRQGQSAVLYGYAGGVSPGAAAAPLQQAANAEINALAKQGYLVQRTSSLHGLLEFTNFTEAGTRNSVFDTVFKAKRKQGLSEYEAMIEAAYAAQDTLDFSRWGSKTQAMRALTPFVNSNFQGLEKAYRTMIAPLIQEAVTTTDVGARRNAIYSLTKFSAVSGALGAAWAAIHSSDEIYQDASPALKGTHFVTSVGNKILVVPKPFELSLGFTAGEYAYQRLMKDDPRAAEQFAKAAFDVLMPPVPIFANPLIKVSAELALGRSFFTGRDIVPNRLQRLAPELQYTDRTSSLGKQIGEAIGVSPIKVDYGIGGYFGLWGRDIMSLSSGIDPDSPTQAIEDSWGMRRFIKDPTRSSNVTTKFWEYLAQSTGKYNQAVATYEALTGRRSVEGDAAARAMLTKLPENERAYVIMKSAANEDGKPAFNADTKRLHPLQRSYDAVTVLNGVRQEILDNSFYSFETGERMTLSPKQRGELRDATRELAQKEMRNALVIMKEPGYVGRPLSDLDESMIKIRAVSPEAADEIAHRYASKKIYDTVPIAKNYDRMRAELLRAGSEADLGRMLDDAENAGYQFGAERVKKPQKRRVRIPARPGVAE